MLEIPECVFVSLVAPINHTCAAAQKELFIVDDCKEAIAFVVQTEGLIGELLIRKTHLLPQRSSVSDIVSTDLLLESECVVKLFKKELLGLSEVRHHFECLSDACVSTQVTSFGMRKRQQSTPWRHSDVSNSHSLA